jgi:LuxR family transcriptional regulator, regulator of acetate metabolism
MTSELARRISRAGAEVSQALDLEADVSIASSTDALAGLIASVEARLATHEDDAEGPRAAATHAAQLKRLTQRYEARFTAMAAVREAVAALRGITSPGTILSRAPEKLCRCSQLDRAVVSLVRDGYVVAEAAWFRDDAVGAVKALEALGAGPPRLEHPLIETDVLRRRRATLVTGAQVHPRVHRPTARTMGWHTYVAAPVVVRGEVIGVIHADAATSGRALDVLDGDVLWTFAKGLAEVYETASLRRSLRRQSSEMRRFVEWFGARSSELSDASLELAPEQGEPPKPPGKLDAVAAGSHVDDRVVFEGLLTRRELDVLRLVVRGLTNSAVAAELVISRATVKFHVTNILRKLHVRNRAEAVSRYHRLVRGSAAGRTPPGNPVGKP